MKDSPIILHIDLGNQSVSKWLEQNRYIIFSELVRYTERLIKENLNTIQAIMVSNLSDNIVFIIKKERYRKNRCLLLRAKTKWKFEHFKISFWKIACYEFLKRKVNKDVTDEIRKAKADKKLPGVIIVDDKKRFYKDGKHKILSGVCSGLGHYFSVDPFWIRLLFVLSPFFTVQLFRSDSIISGPEQQKWMGWRFRLWWNSGA